MPRKYSSVQKAAALVQIERNNGDIPYTSSQLGIPVRTLREWNGGIQAWLLPRTPPRRQNPGVIPAFSNDVETLTFIRQQIMDELLRLSVSLKEDPGHSTPYQRVLVLSQLMDRLMKLDTYLQPYADDDADDWLEGTENEERDDDEYYDEELGWYRHEDIK
jgi:hypothetical protein